MHAIQIAVKNMICESNYSSPHRQCNLITVGYLGLIDDGVCKYLVAPVVNLSFTSDCVNSTSVFFWVFFLQNILRQLL